MEAEEKEKLKEKRRILKEIQEINRRNRWEYYKNKTRGYKYVFARKMRYVIFYTTTEVRRMTGLAPRYIKIMREIVPVYEDEWGTVRYPSEWVYVMYKWYLKFEQQDEVKQLKRFLEKHRDDIIKELKLEVYHKYGKI